MSTRACYRFISDEGPTGWPGPITVYKHSDGYPSGAAEWIEAAKEYAWPLPRFEHDEFAAAFVAANKNQTTYYERLVRKAEEKINKLQSKGDPLSEDYSAQLLKLSSERDSAFETLREYRTGRYKDMVGGGIRLVPYEGMNAHARFASDTEYLYDISVVPGKTKAVRLNVVAYTTIERDGKWWVKKFFEGPTHKLKFAKPPEYDEWGLGEPSFVLNQAPLELRKIHRVKIVYDDPDKGTWLGPLETLSVATARSEKAVSLTRLDGGLVSIQVVE